MAIHVMRSDDEVSLDGTEEDRTLDDGSDDEGSFDGTEEDGTLGDGRDDKGSRRRRNAR